ncbi:MAG: TetR/AcrR family transcriptional regulator [Pseudomonadota bacterium]
MQERKPTELRQTEIVDAAMRILAFQGARRFTAQLIGEQVGVTAGAIFRHFKTMDAIGDAIIDRLEAILFQGFPPKEGDAIERLGVFFRQRVQTIVANPHISSILLTDHLAQTAGQARANRLKMFKQRSRNFVLACLREARRTGTLRGNAGTQEGAILVLGAIFALAHARMRTQDGAAIERLARSVWSVIESTLRGIGRPDKKRLSGKPGRKTRRDFERK